MLLHLWWSFCQIIQSQGRDGSWKKDEEELDQLRRDSRDRSSCRHSNLKENIMASTLKTLPKEENWVKAVIFYINATYMNKYFVFCWVRRQLSVINCQFGQLSVRTTVSGDYCQRTNCQQAMDNCQRKLSELWNIFKYIQPLGPQT